MASVLATAADGIIIIDETARILMLNQACEALFGYSAEQMLGSNVKTLMPSEFAERPDAFVTASMRTGERNSVGAGREVKGRHRDGTQLPLDVLVGEAMTPEGRQFVGILRDLRGRRDTEQRLNQLQADLLRMARISAMDEMGAALAHELNQPLTALMLYLQAALRAHVKSAGTSRLLPQVVDILGKAVGEAERAGNIIQRIRHFVEKRDPVRRAVDLNPLVDDAVELTLLGHPPGTRIVKHLAPELPPAVVDPIQIQQVIVNLVRNAIDAVDDNAMPNVRVETRASGDAILVTVEDNGPGIAPAALPELFKAFSSGKGSGLGIGLAISKSIAQNHGGDLTVDPGGGGRGACFTLTLPIQQSMTEPAQSACS